MTEDWSKSKENGTSFELSGFYCNNNNDNNNNNNNKFKNRATSFYQSPRVHEEMIT